LSGAHVELVRDHYGPALVDHPKEEARENHVSEFISLDDRRIITRARRGVDLLLELYDTAKIIKIQDQQGSGPWLLVDLETDGGFQHFAIWKQTGNVYRANFGEVEEDPYLLITPFDELHGN